ncbi:uncharacterized protein TNCT_116911 [Trichonephila clavata]|uniref:Uncharacterized protein n=1 Tax=Trichonephila clavata TaxID=2740835 RepID=A0A8X6K368_TRICU|nr:uncharacterized protein TNCT_116911 [Trichonephila clavata]
MECKSFEEEIYNFLTFLNFDISKIREILNLSFVESTRFIPVSITTWVSEYKSEELGPICPENTNFGPSYDILNCRWIMGKLSECVSKSTIISCNNAQAIKDENFIESMPEYTLNYNISRISAPGSGIQILTPGSEISAPGSRIPIPRRTSTAIPRIRISTHIPRRTPTPISRIRISTHIPRRTPTPISRTRISTHIPRRTPTPISRTRIDAIPVPIPPFSVSIVPYFIPPPLDLPLTA